MVEVLEAKMKRTFLILLFVAICITVGLTAFYWAMEFLMWCFTGPVLRSMVAVGCIMFCIAIPIVLFFRGCKNEP